MFIWDDVQRTLYDTDGHAFYSANPNRNAAFDAPCCMTNEILRQISNPTDPSIGGHSSGNKGIDPFGNEDV